MASISAPADFRDVLQAGERGDVDVQTTLGTMYHDGLGVGVDWRLALLWYGRAAFQGHKAGQFFFAGMHANGRGVPRDYAAAYYWASLSAAQGMGQAITLRDALERTLTAEQVIAIQLEARVFKPRKLHSVRYRVRFFLERLLRTIAG
jgi:uncharacterized protein